MRQVANDITVDVVPTNDLRSYHVSSEKMRQKLGFQPKHTIEDAIRGLVDAFREGKLPNSLDDPRYFNIKRMQELSLK
jgi:dTDP-D-glucose 4,6-dehydratase